MSKHPKGPFFSENALNVRSVAWEHFFRTSAFSLVKRNTFCYLIKKPCHCKYFVKMCPPKIWVNRLGKNMGKYMGKWTSTPNKMPFHSRNFVFKGTFTQFGRENRCKFNLPAQRLNLPVYRNIFAVYFISL